jgi:hypothetical protein
MKSVALCYAPGDEAFARQLADSLESNLPFAVSLSDAVVGPERDLIEAAERALSAEAAIVLLSPFSVPGVLDLKSWQKVFLEQPKELLTHIGFVLLGDCPYPKLLRRERFFDASVDRLKALREIKRWLLRPNEKVPVAGTCEPELEELRSRVADRPGLAEGLDAGRAVQFAAAHAEDFEAIYRVDCHARSRATILGEIGSAVGLRLAGRTEQNRELLSEWCEERRVLFVLAGVNAVDRDFVFPGGRASAIFTGALPNCAASAAGEAARAFEGEVRSSGGNAIWFGWKAVNLLKEALRLAEALEVLDAMARVALDAGDLQVLSRVEREQYWIRDDLDYEAPAIASRLDPAVGGQLSFAF